MEDLSDVSSEEELLELRNEGKISEDEYEQLRRAMQESRKTDVQSGTKDTDRAKQKRKLGKIAFCLMLVGIILPVVGFMVIETMASPNAHAAIGPWFFLGLVLEISAFVIGVIGWPDVFAKATVVSISLLIVLAFLFVA